MNIEQLNSIKNSIEKMDKKNHIQILKLFKQYPDDIILNENNNGIFINIIDISPKIIQELEKYIKHIEDQKEILDKDENEKNKLENIYFKSN